MSTSDLLQYQSLIMRTIYHFVSDYELTRDLTQDVFERLLTLTNCDTLPPAYIKTVATNIAIDYLRMKRRRHYEQWVSIDDYDCADATLLEDRVADRDCIRTMMQRLPRQDRQMLFLIVSGFSYSEMQDILGIATMAALKMCIFRARKRFRVYQKEKEDCYVPFT